MKLISHRGNLYGPNPDIENRPYQIQLVLTQGYDCEIDLRYINGTLYLGHDTPDWVIDHDFLEQPGLWIHAKNLAALEYLKRFQNLEYFWHQIDDYTLTSKNHIWTYPDRPLSESSIAVMPELHMDIASIKTLKVFAVCSDFVGNLKED